MGAATVVTTSKKILLFLLFVVPTLALSLNTATTKTRSKSNSNNNMSTSPTQQQKELPWRDTNHSPLTGNDLRNLVIEASILEEEEEEETEDDDDDSFLNVPGIAWLEHINLIVGGNDRQMATKFYIDIMGMTADKSKSFHVNLGRQQFHLAIPKKDDDDDEEEEIPHRISGSIGIAVPDIYTLKERLIQAKKEKGNNSFHDTLFDFYEEEEEEEKECVDGADTANDTTIIIVRCPWGNIFRCYSANDRGRTTTASSLSSSLSSSLPSQSPPSKQKMTNLHSLQIGQHGPDKMGVLSVGQPGIRYIEFLCPYRSSNQIYNFYRTILRCSCYCTNVNNNNKMISCCVVSVGPGVHLVFVEESESESKSYSDNHSELSSSLLASKSATTPSTDNDNNGINTIPTMNKKMMKGVHICIYVHDFYGLYNRLTDHSLIWTNPRFVHLDTCNTWEEAKKSRTLRFRYIIDINDNNNEDNNGNNNQKNVESNNNKDNNLVGSTSVGSNSKILMELEHEIRPIRHGQFMKVPFYAPK
jgi:hypothetical protein